MHLSKWLMAAFWISACASSQDDTTRTREQFCIDWAKAACSPEVISACQAASAEACHLRQQAACLQLVPQNFSDARGDACLKAVSAAYADADLDGAELANVLELAGPCGAIVRGPVGRGEACSTNRDCDASQGVVCVLRGGASEGTCQEPEVVGAGQKCAALQQICGDGFYCDGKNCIAAKELGDDCASSYECGQRALCGADSLCRAKLERGAPCVDSSQCLSGICYSINGQTSCVDRVRLAPAEALCDELR